MNEFTLIREHGPEPIPLSDDVLAKARADLLTEIHATTSTETRAEKRIETRPVRLRRRAVFIAASVAAAAVVAGVVATSGTDATAPPSAAKPVLVKFHMPALPPELNPVPAGLAGPSFTGEPGWLAAIYNETGSGPVVNSVYVTAYPSRPDSSGDEQSDTTYAGKPAVLARFDQDEPEVHSVSLGWERAPGLWVKVTGSGDFADEQIVRSLADTLVDTDKQLSLDISVAPAGWEMYAFKGAGPDGDGAVTSLRDPQHPDRTIHVSTMLGLVPNYGQVVEGGPRDTIPVSIKGRQGELVLIPGDRWMLQAPLPDGRAFQLQVPADFTQQQVVELAEGVS